MIITGVNPNSALNLLLRDFFSPRAFPLSFSVYLSGWRYNYLLLCCHISVISCIWIPKLSCTPSGSGALSFYTSRFTGRWFLIYRRDCCIIIVSYDARAKVRPYFIALRLLSLLCLHTRDYNIHVFCCGWRQAASTNRDLAEAGYRDIVEMLSASGA